MRGRPRLPDYHGTIGGYRNHGCRCEPCTKAQTRWSKGYRLRTRADRNGNPTVHSSVPAEPVRAHIAALVTSGWTLKGIARESGASFGAVQRIAAGHRRRVWMATAVAIADLEPFAPVLVDEIVVDRLIHTPVDGYWRDLGANRDERIAAAELADRAGVPRAHIERRYGLRAGRDFAVREQIAS